jgi:triphosphoribosyl-dephospho-CoA synthase
MNGPQLTFGQCAALASTIEATAPKPGNVHRGADFEDVSYPDFIVSGIALAPIFERAHELSLGQLVLQSVEATQQFVGTNTNLGMVLLFAPLAKVPRNQPLAAGVAEVLQNLSAADATDVYAAIVAAQPGGLGKAEEADVHGAAPPSLVDAMQMAADRDLVARQYADNFHHVLHVVVPHLKAALQDKHLPLADAVVDAFLHLLAAEPDSLIARKCGLDVAKQASARAARVLAAGPSGDSEFQQAIADFDFWLRSDHHRRNPGTTADLVAAGLFACLRDGIIKPPFHLAAQIAEG